MSERTCVVDDCAERHYCKGYCKLHYSRMRTKGTTDAPVRKHPRRLSSLGPDDDKTFTKTCPTCGRSFTFDRQRGQSSRTYCSLECRNPRLRPDKPRCSVDRCGKPVKARGWCDAHYIRWLKTGSIQLKGRESTGKCYHCGAAIAPPRRLYCSQLCMYRDKNGLVEVERSCPTCGELFKGTDNLKKFYCNAECAAEYRRHKRYGITPAQAREMNPAGTCQICGAAVALVIDHCHDTGAVRGLICSPCNVGVGMFRDDPSLMRKAIAYLRR